MRSPADPGAKGGRARSMAPPRPRRFRRFAAAVALAGAAGMVAAALAWAAGARINTTRSIPLGLYWVSGAPLARGAFVLVCPPKAPVFDAARARGYLGAGFCPGGYGYLMKRILATQGDVVTVSDEGVRVNGALLPSSAPRAMDGAGRALPRVRSEPYALGASEVLLMSDASRTAFDARYFGPLPRAQIQAVLAPVLTW